MAGAYSKLAMTPLTEPSYRSYRFNRLLVGLCIGLLALLAAIYLLILASVPSFYDQAIHGQIATQYIAGSVYFSQAMLNTGATLRGMSLPAFLVYNLALN